MQSDAPDSIILMTATVNNADFDYDLTNDPEWNCVDVEENNTVCKRQWTAEMFTAEGEKTFSDTHLILKKQVAQKCENVEVDGVTICISKGHNMEFTCRYPLDAQLVSNTYDVSGHDTNISKEGEGKLNYKLTVVGAEDIKIGDKVTVNVEAVNPGLVYHSLRDCTVKNNDQEVSILNWHEEHSALITYCPNILGAFAEIDSGISITRFSWTAFKWSTDAENDVENQTIECKIALSQDYPFVRTDACDNSYMKVGDYCFKKMSDDDVKPNEAKGKCTADNAYVPVPGSQDENDKLVQFAHHSGLNHRILLGIEDERTEGTYRNMNNGQEVAYSIRNEDGEVTSVVASERQWNNWGNNEPNNQHKEDFVEMVLTNNDDLGKWNDIQVGSTNIKLICQKPSYFC